MVRRLCVLKGEIVVPISEKNTHSAAPIGTIRGRFCGIAPSMACGLLMGFVQTR